MELRGQIKASINGRLEQSVNQIKEILAGAKNRILLMLPAISFVMAGGFLFWPIRESPAVRNQSGGQTFLRSAFGNKESYDGVFSSLSQKTFREPISAGIVSHHFLAKELIAGFYNQIKDKDISTVFLVSPDHYDNFYKPGIIAYTSCLPWQTPFGNLAANEKIIDRLSESGRISVSDSVTGLEHGISVEAPFIKYFFPKAEIVPVIVKSDFTNDDCLNLGRTIGKISGDESILIVSSDFAHNEPFDVARAKDNQSIEILKDLSFDKIDGVTNDCRSCLAVLAGFLEGRDYDFSLLDNKNSFDFSKEGRESVTSYISGYYYKK